METITNMILYDNVLTAKCFPEHDETKSFIIKVDISTWKVLSHEGIDFAGIYVGQALAGLMTAYSEGLPFPDKIIRNWC